MHYAEKVSKGTGVQAALLAPQHVRVHRLRRGNEYAIQVYPIGEAGAQAAAEGVADGAVDGEGGVDPPLQFDPQTDVVLFPGPGAKTAAELKAEGKTPRRVIIIDSSVRSLATSQRPLGDSHNADASRFPRFPAFRHLEPLIGYETCTAWDSADATHAVAEGQRGDDVEAFVCAAAHEAHHLPQRVLALPPQGQRRRTRRGGGLLVYRSAMVRLQGGAHPSPALGSAVGQLWTAAGALHLSAPGALPCTLLALTRWVWLVTLYG